ncbi:MAG TPA: TIGR02453 family protein [Kofleriaceae bacterium]|nr:TIGR02453 family protein [Kofleriaceae bacterium]
MSRAQAKSREAPATFTGFSREAMAFWAELALEMNKDWFTANKARYERQWVEPMTALLQAVTSRLARSYRGVALAPSVMRIYRDVRFAQDKAPYKTHIAGVIMLAGGTLSNSAPAALYLRIGLDDELAGAGSYDFDPDQLARWRKAVAGKPGSALAKLIRTLRDAGYEVGGIDDYKRVPKPYPDDHPHAELLKQRGLVARFPAIPRGMLHQARLADWLVERAAAVSPLVSWLHKHVP